MNNYVIINVQFAIIFSIILANGAHFNFCFKHASFFRYRKKNIKMQKQRKKKENKS